MALEICQSLDKAYGLSAHRAEMESAIYEEIDNLPAAKSVCQEYLASSPENFTTKLRLAVINFRTNSFGELDHFLKSPIDPSKLSLKNRILLAQLYAARNFGKELLDTIYETRRTHFGESDAHGSYVVLFFSREKGLDEWLHVDGVAANTAVCIEDSSGKRTWYIIDDRDDADLRRGEINPRHPLARVLTGKSTGEEIVLRESRLARECGRIVDIKSKYIHALHETLESFPRWFPDATGLERIELGALEEGQVPRGMQVILRGDRAGRPTTRAK